MPSRKNSLSSIFTTMHINKEVALSLYVQYYTQAPCFTPWSR